MIMLKQRITKSQKRLFVLLGLLAAYAIYDFATAKPKSKSDKTVQNTQTEIQPEPGTMTQVVASSVSPVIVFASWRRDPFRRNIEISSKMNLGKMVESLLIPKLGNFNLTAISRKGNKSYALINDQIVSIGDTVNGFRLVEIQSTKVILKKNDFTFTLSLPEEEYYE